MLTNELALIDLSSIAYPIWHQSQSEPDPDRTSQLVVARVHALTTEHARAAICCDAGRSFRHDITPTYKATRPEHDASLQHQITLAKERLQADGYPVWAVPVLKPTTSLRRDQPRAVPQRHRDSPLVTGDKDLSTRWSSRAGHVRARRIILDVDGVKAKFGCG